MLITSGLREIFVQSRFIRVQKQNFGMFGDLSFNLQNVTNYGIPVAGINGPEKNIAKIPLFNP